MNRIKFYILRLMAIMLKLVSEKMFDRLIVAAHKSVGVLFQGKPEYIDYHSHIDPSGGVKIGKQVVISTNVIILSHDWSYLKGLASINYYGMSEQNMQELAHKSVTIGEYSFIGAGVIVLPGTTIGKYCIIGAGAVVKGNIPDYSVVVGNPCKIINDTRTYGQKFVQK